MEDFSSKYRVTIDRKLYSIETTYLFDRDNEVLFHFTKRGGFGHKTNLTLPLFLEVPMQIMESE